jgi:4-hydroxy-tetrahydrodipicolinate reductase
VSKKTGKIIKLAVVGASGRMGQEILALITEDKGFQIVTKVSSKEDKFKGPVDVVVDFSTPKGLDRALSWCVENGSSLVSGTTGLSAADQRKIKKAARSIPILYSGNMSLGIAVMTGMLEKFRAIEDWDFQIEEAHHSQKKDKPSGTALLLESKLTSVLGRKLPPTHSLRGGGIPGIHQVWAMGPDEAVILQHTAFNRKVFARGALRAARWLFDKARPGLYDLTDLYKVI